ncbi:prepilin-type N-terminal cleavage/methylation domain-containing protein [Agromyces sp. PvR057]|uniref:PilW family protein n=1 Tax=Agromyces sp. PvR057 TaxID=3156403 RepID=UPI003391F56B
MIVTRSRRLRRVDGQSDDAGLSLVELLVAVMLMGIVLTMVASLFISTTKSTAQSGEVHESTGNASNMANALGGVIRFATTNPKTGSTVPDPALVVARADRLALIAAVGVSATAEPSGRPPKPTLVEFSSASNRLTERRWTPTSSGATWVFAGGSDPTTAVPAMTRGLGGRLTNAAVFTYFDATGAPLDPGTGALTAAQRANVAEIGIRLVVVPPSNPTGAQSVVIERRIPLANLGLRGPT